MHPKGLAERSKASALNSALQWEMFKERGINLELTKIARNQPQGNLHPPKVTSPPDNTITEKKHMIAPQKWHHNQSQNQHEQRKKTVFNEMRFAYVGRDAHYIEDLPVTNC